MLKIDFGSGYNPKAGYKTCDMTYAPFLDYCYDKNTNTIIGLDNSSVDKFYMKNVLHHCNINNIIALMDKYLKKGGKIEIIEPTIEKYSSNRCLDILWYRVIIPRYEVAIPPVERVDYLEAFLATDKYELVNKATDSIYDKIILRRRI